MEPRIQYAKTADGVSIAFCTTGEGTPLILPPIPANPAIQPYAEVPAVLSWLERTAEGRCLVWYDGRGTGLSQRELVDWSLDAAVIDLEAVVNRLDVQRCAVMGRYFAAAVAISYAARHQDRVMHLILWSPYAQASDWTKLPQAQALLKVLDTDLEMYTESLAQAAMH
jgi:pimeloyl-ACP methyl ester carboxylesterase